MSDTLNQARANLRECALHYTTALVGERVNQAWAEALEAADRELQKAARNYALALLMAAPVPATLPVRRVG